MVRNNQQEPPGCAGQGTQDPVLWSAQGHLTKGTALSPGLSGSQLPEAEGMGCFLRADQLLLPVRSSYLERHIQNHLQEEGGSRGTWMPKGNRHLCCQWKQGRARGSELLSHGGDELSGAFPYPDCEGGGWEQHQRFPLKPSQPARHRPRNSPCKTPGKSAKTSIFCLPTVGCI